MQLSGAAALACALALAVPVAHADDAVDARVLIYADDDATTVTTSTVDGEAEVAGGVRAGAHVLVDVVSTASVDVVSAATTRWDETRIELGARAGAEVRGVELDLGVTLSGEEDFRSTAVSLGGARELAAKSTRLSAAYGLVANHVGRAEDPSFLRELRVHHVELGVTQVLNPCTWVGATYSLSLQHGFQSSPYRFVVLDDDSALPERHPGGRVRHALSLRTVRAVGATGAWDSTLRLYADDWGVAALTAASAWRVALAGAWSLRLRARAHAQQAADFYRERYDAPLAYVSADRELSSFWSLGGGARVTWRRGGFALDAGADVTRWSFLDFARLPSRLALVTAAGARWSW